MEAFQVRRPSASFLAAAVVGVGVLVASGCGSGRVAAQERTVQVDFRHDEYASSFERYFPESVVVHPGDTVTFRQEWTGEPHSVTFGTLVDTMISAARPLTEKYGSPFDAPPQEASAFEAVSKPLPSFFPENGGIALSQAAARPCFIDSGAPPTGAAAPCRKRAQPSFTGRQSYYSSGFIRYQGGPGANVFRVQLAPSIAPGVYHYYCNVHGPSMSGQVVVRPNGQTIPSQVEVDRRARTEIARLASPLLRTYKDALAHRYAYNGHRLSGNLAGLLNEHVDGATVNEFIPRTLEAHTGEAVTWTLVGGHTVSFNVPPYFADISVKRDGTVVHDPRTDVSAGAPGFPSVLPERWDRTKTFSADAGTWDGKGFLNSGASFGISQGGSGPPAAYTVRFSRPGHYRFACLIHPPMVGTIVVT